MESSEETGNFSLYKKLFEMSSDAMVITDGDLRIIHVNPAFTHITGYSEAEVVGKCPVVLSSGSQDSSFYRDMWRQLRRKRFWQGEVWNKRKNQQIFPAWQTINTIGSPAAPLHYIAVFSDITRLKEAKQQLWELGHFDSLTGLVNRNMLEQRIHQEVSTAQRLGHAGALMFLDLDNFKTVNDSLGHRTGDLLLIRIAERLKKLFRLEDVVARLGADEFVVLLNHLPSSEEQLINHVAHVVKKTLESLEAPIIIQHHELRVSASIGITLFSKQANNVETLLKQADTAMYTAKKNSQKSYCFYHPRMQREVDKRLELEKQLHVALANDQFELFFQPLFAGRECSFIGCEALLRWHHPSKGIIPPDDFIPVCEENGLIIDLGEKVLTKAFQQMEVWHRQGVSVTHLSVNISASQFNDEHFVDKVVSRLQGACVDPRHIVLEITEGVIVQNIDVSIDKMRQLKHHGIRFSIDDFGTGYSTLAYLTQLPIDELKIDRSFVSNMEQNRRNAVIVDTIIAMAKHLNLNVIAEGVETREQLDYLIACGCPCFQGFYFSRPVPQQKIAELFRS